MEQIKVFLPFPRCIGSTRPFGSLFLWSMCPRFDLNKPKKNQLIPVYVWILYRPHHKKKASRSLPRPYITWLYSPPWSNVLVLYICFRVSHLYFRCHVFAHQHVSLFSLASMFTMAIAEQDLTLNNWCDYSPFWILPDYSKWWVMHGCGIHTWLAGVAGHGGSSGILPSLQAAPPVRLMGTRSVCLPSPSLYSCPWIASQLRLMKI